MDNQGGKFPDPAGGHVASAQRRCNEYHASDFGPVTKKQFLAKILPRFRRKRYFIRRSAEDFHPKLIAAVGEKHPANATPHAVANHYHGLEMWELFLHFIKF